MRRLKLFLGIFGFFLAVFLTTWVFADHIMSGAPLSYASYSAANFAGHIFFISVPVEELIYSYYILLGYSPMLMFFLAVITALTAQFIDYSIGFTVSKNTLNSLIDKKKRNKTYHLLEKYGGSLILIFNFFPLSSPIICLCAGILKYDLKKTFFYSFLGLSLKYLLINVILLWFL